MSADQYFQVSLDILPRRESLPFDLYGGAEWPSAQLVARRGAPYSEQLARLQAASATHVWVRTMDRPRLIDQLEGHLGHILDGDGQPTHCAALAVETVLHLSEHVYGASEASSLAKPLRILRQVTESLVKNSDVVPECPKTGQPHELSTHSRNVYLYTMVFCRRIGGFVHSEQTQVAMGAFLHDIGMVGRLEGLSRRPGTLSAEEYARIKQHTLWSPDAAAVQTRVSPGMQDVIRHHHERLDGSGYPDGLEGAKVSLPARIVAIASTFNALTSRPWHRRPFSAFAALDMMARMDRQFDPDLLREFVLLLGDARSMASG